MTFSWSLRSLIQVRTRFHTPIHLQTVSGLDPRGRAGVLKRDGVPERPDPFAASYLRMQSIARQAIPLIMVAIQALKSCRLIAARSWSLTFNCLSKSRTSVSEVMPVMFRFSRRQGIRNGALAIAVVNGEERERGAQRSSRSVRVRSEVRGLSGRRGTGAAGADHFQS